MPPYAASITSEERSDQQQSNVLTAIEQLWVLFDDSADEDNCESEKKAREVWTMLSDLCATTNEAISAVTTFGEENPSKFARFLRINNAPGIKWVEEGHESTTLCMLSFQLHVFEKMPASYFDCMAPCERLLFGKNGKDGTRHTKVVRRLLWVINYVLDNTPEHVLGNLKLARMYTHGLFGTDSDRSEKMLGDASNQFSMALPFQRPGNLLRCFGYNREAVGYTRELKTRSGGFPSVTEIIGVMEDMDAHFESLFGTDPFTIDPYAAWEKEGPISLDTATEICRTSMEIEPLYWTLTESATHKKGPYRRNRNQLAQRWEAIQADDSIDDKDGAIVDV